MSEELVQTILQKSNMNTEESVEWLREWIRAIDQQPAIVSSSLARELYDTMMEDQRCPRCGIGFRHLSYVEQQQTDYLYECIRCGEMY